MVTNTFVKKVELKPLGNISFIGQKLSIIPLCAINLGYVQKLLYCCMMGTNFSAVMGKLSTLPFVNSSHGSLLRGSVGRKGIQSCLKLWHESLLERV